MRWGLALAPCTAGPGAGTCCAPLAPWSPWVVSFFCGRRWYESVEPLSLAARRGRHPRRRAVYCASRSPPQCGWHGTNLRRLTALPAEPRRPDSRTGAGAAGWIARRRARTARSVDAPGGVARGESVRIECCGNHWQRGRIVVLVAAAGRPAEYRRQTALVGDDRFGGAAGSCARLLERHGHGPVGVCGRRGPWIDCCSVCAEHACRRVRGAVAGTLGTHRRARRRQLDRCQWFADARLVVARTLALE